MREKGVLVGVTQAEAQKTEEDRRQRRGRPGAESGRGRRPALGTHGGPGLRQPAGPGVGAEEGHQDSLPTATGQRAADERGGLRREQVATRDRSGGEGGQGAELPT